MNRHLSSEHLPKLLRPLVEFFRFVCFPAKVALTFVWNTMGILDKYELSTCVMFIQSPICSAVSWGFHLMFCSFVNELNYLIILVQVRGEKRSILDILTWSLSSLQGHRAEKPVPDLTAASSPKSTADTSVSGCWLTLSQTYKEPHWRTRVLGFCYLKTRGKSVALFIFSSRGWLDSFPKDAFWSVWLVPLCLHNRQVVSYSAVGVFKS